MDPNNDHHAKVLGTTPDVVQELLKDIAKGLSLEEASILHGVPFEDVETLHENDPQFALRVRRAHILMKRMAFENMLSETGKKTGAATRLLDRLFPAEEKKITPERVSKIIQSIDTTPLVDPRTNPSSGSGTALIRPPSESPLKDIKDAVTRAEGANSVLGSHVKDKPKGHVKDNLSDISYSIETF